MKFSRFFDDWLYAQDGYYEGYKAIGKDGDFYTSVSSSSFFGGTIGKKIVDTIKEGFLDNDTTILEIGAHHGYLLADIIQFIFTLEPKLIKTLKFAIVEKHEKLRIKQLEYFKQSFGDEIQLIHYNSLEDVELKSAYVVANEIFDAFACELIYTKGDIKHIGIVEKGNDEYKIEWEKIEDEELLNHCQKYKIEKGEIGLGYQEFALSLKNSIKKFEFITFDYGDRYPRNDFSARIYHQHKVYPLFEDGLDLKSLYQKSDITYDVHFNHLIDCFEELDIQNIYFGTQLKALVEFGIVELLEILQKNTTEEVYLRELTKAKTLLEPIGMGERFKCVVFRKNTL
jgi:SAM-dependent MidA family methyltransferase